MITPFTRLSRIVIAGALAFVVAGCNGKDDSAGKDRSRGMPPVPVQTAVAVKKDIPVDLRAIGNVEPIASIAIKAQVGGELIGVSFEEGQDVRKGDLLFTIQPRLYATQLAQAQANLARDRAQAANAKREQARQEELDRKGAGVKEELDRARAAAEAAEATVKADEALVLIAETQVGYTTIESPIDGRTGAIRVRPGNLIKSGDDQPLTTVLQLAPIYVSFAVPEQHLADIRHAMGARKIAVTARDPRGGQTLADGTLTFIANTVDPATGTVTLKAHFPNADHALWPGAFVDVLLHLDVERGVTVVPSSAISSGQLGTILYVVKADATAELRTVKTGRSVAQETVVTDGVTAGEKVIVNGQSRLLPGGRVIEKPAGVAPAKQPEDTGETAAKKGGP